MSVILAWIHCWHLVLSSGWHRIISFQGRGRWHDPKVIVIQKGHYQKMGHAHQRPTYTPTPPIQWLAVWVPFRAPEVWGYTDILLSNLKRIRSLSEVNASDNAQHALVHKSKRPWFSMINDEYTMSNTYLNDSVQTEIKFTNDTAPFF